MVTLKNEFLTADFSEIGAELKSLKCDGKEYIWNGDPKYWTGSSPTLFPICSGLKDDEFIYNGKSYNMQKHGFARRSKFEVESVNGNTATFLLSSKNNPKDNYPFEYEFRITYTLKGKTVTVEYNIKNLTDGDMYFSVGAHEAYACPGGSEKCEVVFEFAEDFDAYQLDKSFLLTEQTVNYGKNTNTLAINDSLFVNDCLIFKKLKSHYAYLHNKMTDGKIKVNFDGFDYLIIWTVPGGAEFLCIEPWCGVTDNADTSKLLPEKEGIVKLEKGKSFYKSHSFEIIK